MSRKLRVLSVLDGFSFGGDENRVLQLVQAIDRERFDFRVATIRPNDANVDRIYGNLRGEFERAGVSVVDLSVPRVTRGLALNDPRRHVLRVGLLAGTVARIARYVRRERIDVIDGHHGAGYLTGTIAGVLTGVPSLLTTYNVSETWHPRWLWNAMHRTTLAASRAVVTDSDAVAGVLRSWMLPSHRARVRVIPNGPPPPVAECSEAEVRAKLGLAPRDQTRVVGQIAALAPGKGQHLLLEAAPAVLERHPDVTFLIVGFERREPAMPTSCARVPANLESRIASSSRRIKARSAMSGKPSTFMLIRRCKILCPTPSSKACRWASRSSRRRTPVFRLWSSTTERESSYRSTMRKQLRAD